MNAIHTLAARPARWLALAALAALLALAAALALGAAQPAGAQTGTNTMRTGMDEDRSNFRLELSLVDDSDGTVPAGSSARIKAVFKFDVPQGKSNGADFGAAAGDHGNFGTAFTLQDGGTLRIAGPYEWENAGGRTLRIDPNRVGFGPETDAGDAAVTTADSEALRLSAAGCADFDDWNDAYDRTTLPTPTESSGTFTPVACTASNVATKDPATPEGWKSLAYAQRGWYGNSGDGFTTDFLPDRMGHQGWCTASTTDAVTTWSCEVPLVDQQFGWLGHNDYAIYNRDYDAMAAAINEWGVTPLRRDLNARDGSITIPTGTPDGAFTVSASISFHSAAGLGATALAANTGVITVTDSLTVNIGTVAEAQSASLDFATQTATSQATVGGQAGQPWPSVVAASDAVGTRFSLAVLNANGKASARGSVSAIALRTNFGLLDSSLGCKGRTAAGLTCEIDTALLDTSNSGAIPLQLLPPANDKAGTATVQGFLLTTSGDSIQLGPLEVTFTGVASAITVSEPTSSILNVVTPAADNRDQLTLSVTAADASDNKATVPTRRPAPTLKDPDGNNVNQQTAGISVDWPLRTDPDDSNSDPMLDAQGNPQVRITVTAAAASALKTGVYTLTLRAGGLTTTREFTVAGEAAAIDVAASESDYGPNDRFTLTATVTNADGSAVPDGTPVVWADPQPAARLVRISATTATKGGEASATYVVIGEGRAWITLTSGAGTGFWSENVGAPAQAPASANPVDDLSARAGFASYLGSADTTASALLSGLGNVNSIRIWQLDRWLLYAVIDGVSPPDAAEDFTVSRGAVLWIGS